MVIVCGPSRRRGTLKVSHLCGGNLRCSILKGSCNLSKFISFLMHRIPNNMDTSLYNDLQPRNHSLYTEDISCYWLYILCHNLYFQVMGKIHKLMDHRNNGKVNFRYIKPTYFIFNIVIIKCVWMRKACSTTFPLSFMFYI